MKYYVENCKTKTFAASYLYREHSHKEIEVNYVVFGECLIVINNNNIVLSKGDCIIILPQIKHNFYVNGINGCRIKQLEFYCDDSIVNLLVGNEYIKLKDCENILKCITNVTTYQTDNEYKQYFQELVDIEIDKMFYLVMIHKQKQELSNIKSNVINRIMIYMQDNFFKDMNFNSMAKEFGYSTRYLHKLFVQTMGMNYSNYLVYLRIQASKKLLVYSDDKISDIAIKVGFNTIQYFSEVFKSQIGITPTEFRKLNKSTRL